MQPLISLSKVSKRYGSLPVLREVDLEIGPGVTGLLGPNGAGKSSLIKMLMGLISVNSGSGMILGHPLGQHGRQIRAKVGYVPEEDCYIPGMTGIEAVQFAACLSGFPRVEALRRSHEILDFCGTKQERYRAIETYSTGMRQKIKFASAIVHDPEFLILDEPTSGLDPEEREQLLNRIRTLADMTGKSVLLSTHILPDVQQICDQVVILAKGQIRLHQSFEELDRPSSPILLVTLLNHREPFIDAARRKGLDVEVALNGQLRISGDLQTLPAKVWELAAASGATIQAIQPAKNSLEEIFIAAVQESSHANL